MEQSFFTVRPANQADLARLVELRAYLLDGTNASYSSNTPEDAARWRVAYRTWLNSRLNDSDCVQILAAEHKESGQVLGCATAIIDQRAPAPGCLNGLSGWVQSVVVEPQWRGRGIARQPDAAPAALVCQPRRRLRGAAEHRGGQHALPGPGLRRQR